MTIHIIHHNDLDGICAAAVVAKHLEETDPGRYWVFYETNYNRPADVSRMQRFDRVFIVDFSYPPDEMQKIEQAIDYDRNNKSNQIVWIDHHKTAAAYGYKYSGLRNFKDKGPSGCELAWYFLFTHVSAPAVVCYIGDYDSWRLRIPVSKVFYEGAKLSLLDPTDLRWRSLFHDNNDLLQRILNDGETATQYRDNYTAGIRRSYGYRTQIEGVDAFAMNLYGFGSGQFGPQFGRFPVVIAYINDGRRFTVSLYSETVDVAEIAKRYGGGGHKGAAGFVCDELPFKISDPDGRLDGV